MNLFVHVHISGRVYIRSTKGKRGLMSILEGGYIL